MNRDPAKRRVEGVRAKRIGWNARPHGMRGRGDP